jgi:hypothetical protein
VLGVPAFDRIGELRRVPHLVKCWGEEMNCPSCDKPAMTQGNIWIVAGKQRTAIYCMNKECKKYGKPIVLTIEEHPEDPYGFHFKGDSNQAV